MVYLILFAIERILRLESIEARLGSNGITQCLNILKASIRCFMSRCLTQKSKPQLKVSLNTTGSEMPTTIMSLFIVRQSKVVKTEEPLSVSL